MAREEVRGFRSALFIDTHSRTHRSGSADTAFIMKSLLLVATFFLVCYSLPEASVASDRGWLVCGCTAVFVLRVQTQMSVFWRRSIPWKEVIFEAGGIIPLSFYSIARGTVAADLTPLDYFHLLMFLAGTYLNFWPELQRHRWKQQSDRAGKLYTGSLFAFARHINYTGEVLSFVGLSLLTGSYWTLWVPACMGCGMATASVWEIEFYLAQKYKDEWPAFCRATKWVLVPGLY